MKAQNAVGLDGRPSWDHSSQIRSTWIEAAKGVSRALIMSCLLRCVSLFLCLFKRAALSHILISIIVVAHDNHSGNLFYEPEAFPVISQRLDEPSESRKCCTSTKLSLFSGD